MKALITGASSGLGAEFARQLSKEGYDIIAVARRIDRLDALAAELPTRVTPIVCDLSDKAQCLELFEKVKNEDIDLVVNNAGFGLLGEFTETDLSRELEMINVNIRALHILMKLFALKFSNENKGAILNTCSIGGFMPGPLLATYYASKAYVLSLTRGVCEEIRRNGSNVYVGCVCPGPVATEFFDVAKAKFPIKGRKPETIVSYALKKMKRKKHIIIPGFEMKLTAFFLKLVPSNLVARIIYTLQKQRG